MVTVGDLLMALRRRWPIMVACLLATLAVGVNTWRSPGVYWASTKVYFLVPATDRAPNRLVPGGAAIPFAGLIEAEINGGVPLRQAISPTVTLVDEGIDDGWSVRVPDTGGQWAHNFPEPSLIVQASGPTAAIVESRMHQLLGRIGAMVSAREDSAQVPVPDRVQLVSSPSDVVVLYSNGHPSRALAVIVVVGLWAGIAACWVADRAAERLRPTAGTDR